MGLAAVVTLAVLVSGCVGQQPAGDMPAPDETVRLSVITPPPAPVEEFDLELSYPYWTEVCDGQGTNYTPLTTFGQPQPIHFLENETRTVLEFEWDAVNPTAEDLKFRLWSGQKAIFHPTGPSPQRWELTPDDIAAMGDSPELEGEPGCDLPGAIASFEGQTVRVRVEHFT